jgi:hypothetical protein
MAKFSAPVDIWNLDDSERAKLQPGQWIKCGDNPHLSRFLRFNPATGHVLAFHGPNATRQFREFLKGERAAIVRRAIRAGDIPPHVSAKWRNGRVANRYGWPVWSGKGPVPTIGSEVVAIGSSRPIVVVTGYEVEAGFLMVTGYRVADGKTGNLAGAEIVARK